MAISLFQAADYAATLKALLPRGRVWPDDPSSAQATALGALALTPARADADAQGLLVDAFPATAVQLLPEWEESLGLPDPCAGPSPTIAQRQGAVVAKLTGRGGQSLAFYEAYAAALGFTITIQEFAPFRAGLDSAGMALAEDQWAFAWGVTVAANIGGLSNTVLLCELNAIKPAHTVVFIQG